MFYADLFVDFLVITCDFAINSESHDVGERHGFLTLIKGKSNLYPGGMAKDKERRISNSRVS